MRRGLVGFMMLAVAVASAGCAAIGLTVLGAGVGVAAATGTAYTLDGIAYRTFTASVDEMRAATLRTLKRMDMAVRSDEPTVEGRRLTAAASDRTIDIELEKLTSRTTRMRITARQGWFWKDRATAGEIIAQTEHALESSPSLTQQSR